jgi:hypothetical protein
MSSPDQPPPDDGPEFLGLLTELRALLPAAKAVITEGSGNFPPQERLTGKLEHVKAAIGALPNTNELFPTRDSYRDVGYAIKASLPHHSDEALELFHQWAARWEGNDKTTHNDPDDVASDWARMKPPFKRGASWLYELAGKHGGGRFDEASVWFDEVEMTDEPDTSAFEKAAPAPRVLLFEPFAEVAKTALHATTKPLVKGLLDQGSMTVLYGESNVGKTFVALDIAYCVSTGRPWAGHKTEKMAVAYVVAEGGRGARRRVAALKRKYGDEDVELYLLFAPVNLLQPDADLKPLVEAIKSLGLNVGLIVIDTLSRAMAGGDENSSVDMGAMVKHLDLVRAWTGSHLMAVHHTGKDRARGARGHSLLRAATDTEIEVSEGQIEVTKQRDIEKGFSSAFVLEGVELGRDADGDAITSATVRLVASVAEAPVGVPTNAEAELLEALGDMGADEEDITVQQVVDFLADRPGGGKMSAEGVRSNIRRLVAKRLIIRSGRAKFRLRTPETVKNSLTALLAVVEDEKETVKSGQRNGQNIFE